MFERHRPSSLSGRGARPRLWLPRWKNSRLIFDIIGALAAPMSKDTRVHLLYLIELGPDTRLERVRGNLQRRHEPRLGLAHQSVSALELASEA